MAIVSPTGGMARGETAEDPALATLGVEEEFALVDAASRELAPLAGDVIADARGALGERVRHELRLCQVEAVTPVCRTLDEVRCELAGARRTLAAAARRHGGAILAAGTHPFSRAQDQPFAPRERYLHLAGRYRQLAREQLIHGCHIHVGLPDPRLGIEILNRVRLWLGPLLALSASSPYWGGEDTGYASYRSVLWGRWPTSGPPERFEDRAEYDAVVTALVGSGAIESAGTIYWDVRLPYRVPTVEFRVTDVCATVEEAVMIAGLCRALVATAHAEAAAGAPRPEPRQDLLRAAQWRAARDGLDGALLDPSSGEMLPAREVMERLLDRVSPALARAGDLDAVAAATRQALERGNGAKRQREAFQRTAALAGVVDAIAAETLEGI